MENAYTLKQDNGNRWSTGVSLADCTIPFVELLNREVSYAEFYKENLQEMKRENERLQGKISEYESLISRFEELYDSTVEEMVMAEEEDY